MRTYAVLLLLGALMKYLACSKNRELCSGAEVGARATILLDDAAGQEIVDTLTVTRFVDAEDMIKAAVFGDDHDHVLDRCRGLVQVRRSGYASGENLTLGARV